MSGRYWREAATLIVVGRAARKFEVSNGKSRNYRGNWTPPDYNTLFLKRSSRSSFMPESYVFPGGALDEADLDPKWLSVFKEHGYSHNDLIEKLRHPGNVPEFYTNKTSKDVPELAFRICALRETFEETGLLLASPAGQSGSSFASLYSLEVEELKEWRRKVHNDASQFINLIQRINALPCVLNLYEWVSWLTPLIFKPAHRFDTPFYITFVDGEIPLYEHDKHEADELKSEGPFQLLQSYHDKRAVLAPPQIYELSRLLRCSTLETLKEFSFSRSTKGMDRIFPVIIRANDGLLFLYPGDSLYPSNPDFYGSREMKEVNLSIDEARESSTHLNRFERNTEPYGNMVVRNITQPCGHLNPLCLADIVEES